MGGSASPHPCHSPFPPPDTLGPHHSCRGAQLSRSCIPTRHSRTLLSHPASCLSLAASSISPHGHILVSRTGQPHLMNTGWRDVPRTQSLPSVGVELGPTPQGHPLDISLTPGGSSQDLLPSTLHVHQTILPGCLLDSLRGAGL